jgi:hypothetical protein
MGGWNRPGSTGGGAKLRLSRSRERFNDVNTPPATTDEQKAAKTFEQKAAKVTKSLGSTIYVIALQTWRITARHHL